jgi:sec-independent protein translocase protein TatA
MHPTWTLIIVVALALLLFMRPGKLSGLMEDLGKGIRGFKRGMTDEQNRPADPPPQVSDQSGQNSTNPQRDRVDN